MRGKKRGALLLAAVLAITLIGVQLPAQAAGSSDPRFLEPIEAPEPGYTEISTAEELKQIKDDPAGYYVLTQDIDLSEYSNWSPISSSGRAFSGVLDGQGHVIRNLSITSLGHVDYPYAGLFGTISGGTVKNLGVENVNIAMGSAYGCYVGAIAGKVTGESVIENCYSTGSIYGHSVSKYNNEPFCAGGLVGWAGENGQCVIRSSYNRAGLSATGRYSATLGGILSVAKGGTSGTGGQVLIQNCFNSGSVQIAITDENTYDVSALGGGLVGSVRQSTLQIQASCNWGAVAIRERNNGDLLAYMSSYAYAGGLVAQNDEGELTIKDCYNSGDVFALEDRNAAYAGGLIGGSNARCAVERCYVSGAVSAENASDGTAYASGLDGYGVSAEDTLQNSFVLTNQISAEWANTVSMVGTKVTNVWTLSPVPDGVNNNATGTVTEEEAGQQSTYAAAGWSFDGGDAVWTMRSGSPYPVLSWEPDSLPGQPVIQGQPKVVNLTFPQEGIAPNCGNTLYVDTTGLTTDQGTEALGALSYQWMRGDRPITGATGKTYLLPEYDSRGYEYSVRVTASGCTGTAFSEKTLRVEDRLMMMGTVKLDNTTPELGDTLHVDVSDLWTTTGPAEDLRLIYKWYRDGSSFEISTAESYTLTDADVDKSVWVRVSVLGATNYVESEHTQLVELPEFAGGTGTEEDPYQISSVKEWQVFLYRVRYQNHIKYTDAHYELTQDIDFSQASPYLYVKNFVGVLDGNDHAIQDMTVQSAATYGEVAVFESLKEGGVIKNLRLENLMVEGSTNVGGLVGLLQDSTLSNCTVSGTVKGTKTAGALACRAENSRISDCRNYAAVSGGSGGGVGGIAGTATNCILERVYNNADISGTGGIVGSMSNGGRIVQAVNCGEVKPVNAYKTGGIVGVLSGSDTSANKEAVLDCCTNLGTVRGSSGSSMAAGGLIGGIDWPGGSSVKITNSINCGDVRISTVAKIGGIVGEVYSTTLVVTNCANTGELTFGTAIGKEKYAGGVVGYVMYSDAVLTVDNFYVSGFPTAGGNDPNSFSYEKFGRLYGGMQYNIPKNCTNCYSNADPKEYIDKNNQSDLYTYVPDMKHADFVSTLNANIAGREGLLTWQLDEEVNGGYPSFVGQGSRILYAGSNGVELYWSGAAPETETDFVLAAYDSEGRLLTVSTTSLTGSLPAQLLFEEPVELTSGCTVKVFCLSKEGLVPQRAALIYEI